MKAKVEGVASEGSPVSEDAPAKDSGLPKDPRKGAEWDCPDSADRAEGMI